MTDDSPGSPRRRVVGTVFDVQRMSIHDGPGIRTTVFTKGCPLRCQWCHNPESYVIGRQLSFTPSLCIGCGYCFKHCPQHAHAMLEGEHVVDRDACARCFVCTEECYARALEVVGREVTVGEVLDEVLRDLPFYETSGGGMTVSGGEPLMQSAFTTALLAEAKAAGLHNCLETCGAYPAGVGLAVLPYVDQVLFDYKETDPEKHKAFTGRDNRQILENLRAMDRAGAEIVLRCPIVPGFNLRDEHLEGIARTAASLAHCAGVHVMGYHRLGAGKRKRFGMDELSGPLCEQPSMTDAEVESVIQRVRSFGYENVSRS